MSVTVITLPIFRGVLRDGSLPGSAIYRHREKVFSIRFSEWCDDRDTRDSSLWAFSLDGGAHLYFVDPYPFNLTRQTQRQSQEGAFLCSFEATIDVGFLLIAR
jgi:hypothetical protein